MSNPSPDRRVGCICLPYVAHNFAAGEVWAVRGPAKSWQQPLLCPISHLCVVGIPISKVLESRWLCVIHALHCFCCLACQEGHHCIKDIELER